MKFAMSLFGFVALLAMTRCSSGTASGTSPEGGADGGPSAADIQKTCADAADAVCAKFQECSPFGLTVAYGDVATCKTRSALGCVAQFAAPGTNGTIAKAAACTQSLAAVSCTDFIGQNLGGACAAIPGTLADGAACGDDGQCTSTFCARAPDAPCGTCSPLSTATSACVSQVCSRGFACPAGAASCIVPVAGKVGDACTVQEQCDLAHSIGCNTSSKKCFALKAAGAGMPCGADSPMPTTFTVCTSGGACSSILNGTCAAAAADGAACSTADAGPHCMAPARCVSSICTLPDAATCH